MDCVELRQKVIDILAPQPNACMKRPQGRDLFYNWKVGK